MDNDCDGEVGHCGAQGAHPVEEGAIADFSATFPFGEFGYALTTADLDGDGQWELVMGAPEVNGAFTFEATARGSLTTDDAKASLSNADLSEYDLFGLDVAGLISNPGLAVSAPQDNAGGNDAGAVCFVPVQVDAT